MGQDHATATAPELTPAPAGSMPLTEYDKLCGFGRPPLTIAEIIDALTIPDGRYRAVIENMGVEDFSDKGQSYRRVTWRLRILGPTHQGRVLFHEQKILLSEPKDHKQVESDHYARGFLRRDLVRCGLPPGDLTELVPRVRELEGVVIRYRQATERGREWIHIESRLGRLGPGGTPNPPVPSAVPANDTATPQVATKR